MSDVDYSLAAMSEVEFHKRWTADVGTHGYNKAAWKARDLARDDERRVLREKRERLFGTQRKTSG